MAQPPHGAMPPFCSNSAGGMYPKATEWSRVRLYTSSRNSPIREGASWKSRYSFAIDLLVLQRFEERFASRIVVGIPFAAHADLRLVLFQDLRILLASVLDAAIGMVHQTRLRFSVRQR